MMIAVLMTACGSSNIQAVNANDQSKTARNMNESTVKNVEAETSIEELKKLINLPVEPSAAKWTAETFDNSQGAIPGPSDYRLTALLRYDDKSAARLSEKLLDGGVIEQSIGNADVKSWFPDEVKKEAKSSDGKTYLEGAKLPPDKFFRAPYRNGKLIRVGQTDYFVLNLFSF